MQDVFCSVHSLSQCTFSMFLLSQSLRASIVDLLMTKLRNLGFESLPNHNFINLAFVKVFEFESSTYQ